VGMEPFMELSGLERPLKGQPNWSPRLRPLPHALSRESDPESKYAGRSNAGTTAGRADPPRRLSRASPTNSLCEQRNTVHLQERSALGQTAFLNQSRKAYGIVTQTIRQTKAWKDSHP
jgi:hypothetical protein